MIWIRHPSPITSSLLPFRRDCRFDVGRFASYPALYHPSVGVGSDVRGCSAVTSAVHTDCWALHFAFSVELFIVGNCDVDFRYEQRPSSLKTLKQFMKRSARRRFSLILGCRRNFKIFSVWTGGWVILACFLALLRNQWNMADLAQKECCS